MKNGIKILVALSISFSGFVGTTAMVNHVAATTAKQCGCGKLDCGGECRLAGRESNCNTCDTQCGCVQCPQCECDICRLELVNSKVKKTCFKVQQKVVCIPPVRFPWKKSCPPGTSRTRTVNTLKAHSYECPQCAYQWTPQQPECTSPPPGENPTTIVSPPARGAVPAFLYPTRQTTQPSSGEGSTSSFGVYPASQR